MRIAIFGKNSPDSYSGGRYHAWMAAEALALAGNDVTIVTNNSPIFRQDFADFPRHDSLHLVVTPDFRTGLPDGPFDVIMVVPHKTKEDNFFLNAEAFAVRTGARLALMCFETPNWFNSMSPFQQDLDLWSGWKYIAKRCSCILCTTKEGERYAREFFAECPRETKFAQCYCSINTLVADSVPERPREKRIICMSRFIFAEHKGGEGVADVICVAMRGYTLVLIVGVGNIPEHVDSRLRAEAERCGVTIEYKYKLTDFEKFEELKRARLLIFLSRFEGYGLPPIEAEYCNVPCIAFDLPVLREVSEAGITYVAVDDYGEFRDRIADVLTNDEGYGHLKESIEPVVSFQLFSERLEKIFSRVSRAKKPRALREAELPAVTPEPFPSAESANPNPGPATPRKSFLRRIGSRITGVFVRSVAGNRFCIRVLRVLLRHDKWRLLRVVGESENYRGIRILATANHNALLKDIVFEGEFKVLRRLLSAGNWTPLRHVVLENSAERLKEILHAEDRKILKRILTEGDYRVLRELLEADSAAVLDKLLTENDYARLKQLLFKDDPSVLRRVLAEADREPLRQMLSAEHGSLLMDFLLEDDYKLLDEILSQKEGYQALWSVLVADQAALLKRILEDNEQRPLKSLLFHDEFRLLREILLTDDATPLRHLLFADNAELLTGMLFDDDERGLRKTLFDDNYEELRRVLRMDESAPLRAVLLGEEKRELKELLFEGEFRLLREMLMTGDATPLRHLLFADNAELLKDILFANDQRGLRGILLSENYQELRKFLDSDDSAILHKLLLENGSARLKGLLYANQSEELRRLLRSDPSHTLFPVLTEDNYELLYRLLAKHPETVLKDLVLRDEGRILEKLLIDGAVLNEVFANKRLDAVRRFQESWLEIIKLIPHSNSKILGRYSAAKRSIADRSEVGEKLLDVICERGKVQLKRGDIRFPDSHSLVTLLHEILLNEDYYFKTKTKSPRILDCGTHIGLGIYFFKNLYPKARITGFEPVPALCKLARKNIERNGFDDVEILPYALSAKGARTTFYVSKDYTMAGSLVDQRRLMGDEIVEITVTCKRLSDYLQEPVHFLKLDIEGVEDEVLQEAQEFLPNVQYIFCEYHQGKRLAGDRLAKILTILEAAGFDVQIGKSHNFQNTSRFRPMNFVTGRYSGVIWAVNRNWSESRIHKAPKASKPKASAKTKARTKAVTKKKATPKSRVKPKASTTARKKTKTKPKPHPTILE